MGTPFEICRRLNLRPASSCSTTATFFISDIYDNPNLQHVQELKGIFFDAEQQDKSITAKPTLEHMFTAGQSHQHAAAEPAPSAVETAARTVCATQVDARYKHPAARVLITATATVVS